MKEHIRSFILRGLSACGFGPMVLAVVYLILNRCASVETLTVTEAVTGIFSLAALAFIAGGMNVVYQIERLPLMAAILIHGGVLYVCYLGTHLINNWLKRGAMPVLIFTCVFIVGYLAIWAVIYTVTLKRTRRVNEMLNMKKSTCEEEENG